MSEKHILHVQKLAGIGGAEKHLSLLLPALVAEGWKIRYLAIQSANWVEANAQYLEKLGKAGVDVWAPVSKDPYGLSQLPTLYRACKQHTFLHSHLIHADFWTAAAAGRRQIRLSTKHGFDENYQALHGLNPSQLAQYQSLYLRLCKYSVRREAHTLTISRGLYTLFQALGQSPERLHHIAYGYPNQKNSTVLPARYWLYMGRLIPFKRPMLLADTWLHYRQLGGTLPLWIAGDGSEYTRLKAKFEAAGLLSEVHMPGRLPDATHLLTEAAGLLITSTSEGFGLVALEAMQAGIPVLGFDVPGVQESVAHQQTGYLAPWPDTHTLAQYMLQCETPELRAQLGKAAIQRAATCFSLDAMVQSTSRLYHQITR